MAPRLPHAVGEYSGFMMQHHIARGITRLEPYPDMLANFFDVDVEELERIRCEQVIAARAAGASWQQIGDALSVSRQSA